MDNDLSFILAKVIFCDFKTKINPGHNLVPSSKWNNKEQRIEYILTVKEIERKMVDQYRLREREMMRKKRKTKRIYKNRKSL